VIVHSYESAMMYHINPMFNAINYSRVLYERFYVPLFELGVGVDFVHDSPP
jgi:hypothetical protein